MFMFDYARQAVGRMSVKQRRGAVQHNLLHSYHHRKFDYAQRVVTDERKSKYNSTVDMIINEALLAAGIGMED